MRSIGRPESRGGWTEVPTVTALEDGYQHRILRAVWKQDKLWLVAADVGAILGARKVERMVAECHPAPKEFPYSTPPGGARPST